MGNCFPCSSKVCNNIKAQGSECSSARSLTRFFTPYSHNALVKKLSGYYISVVIYIIDKIVNKANPMQLCGCICHGGYSADSQ